MATHIRNANESDVTHILGFIRELAQFEKLEHEVVATEASLRDSLFGDTPQAHVLLAESDAENPVGFALYFYNYSTFLGKAGLYIEDVFVSQQSRGHGVGQALFAALAQIAVDKNCERMEWSVLDWNHQAIDFYHRLGSQAMNGWIIHRLRGDSLNALARSRAQ